MGQAREILSAPIYYRASGAFLKFLDSQESEESHRGLSFNQRNEPLKESRA